MSFQKKRMNAKREMRNIRNNIYLFTLKEDNRYSRILFPSEISGEKVKTGAFYAKSAF